MENKTVKVKKVLIKKGFLVISDLSVNLPFYYNSRRMNYTVSITRNTKLHVNGNIKEIPLNSILDECELKYISYEYRGKTYYQVTEISNITSISSFVEYSVARFKILDDNTIAFTKNDTISSSDLPIDNYEFTLSKRFKTTYNINDYDNEKPHILKCVVNYDSDNNIKSICYEINPLNNQ